jgi:hypothetical protein
VEPLTANPLVEERQEGAAEMPEIRPSFRVVRTIEVNQEQLDAIADVLDIPQAERQRLRPGRIRIIKEGSYRIEQDGGPGGATSP